MILITTEIGIFLKKEKNVLSLIFNFFLQFDLEHFNIIGLFIDFFFMNS